MKTYSLALILIGSVDIAAPSLVEAKRIVRDVVNNHTANLGALPDGSPLQMTLEIDGTIGGYPDDEDDEEESV